jgi:hypothetical protein
MLAKILGKSRNLRRAPIQTTWPKLKGIELKDFYFRCGTAFLTSTLQLQVSL